MNEGDVPAAVRIPVAEAVHELGVRVRPARDLRRAGTSLFIQISARRTVKGSLHLRIHKRGLLLYIYDTRWRWRRDDAGVKATLTRTCEGDVPADAYRSKYIGCLPVPS